MDPYGMDGLDFNVELVFMRWANQAFILHGSAFLVIVSRYIYPLKWKFVENLKDSL